jgi:hypothetical protein
VKELADSWDLPSPGDRRDMTAAPPPPLPALPAHVGHWQTEEEAAEVAFLNSTVYDRSEGCKCSSGGTSDPRPFYCLSSEITSCEVLSARLGRPCGMTSSISRSCEPVPLAAVVPPPPPPAPAVAATPQQKQYQGVLASANCGGIGGWAEEVGSATPISVWLKIDGNPISQGTANLPAGSGGNAGGNGKSRFYFTAPGMLTDGRSHTIEVQLPGGAALAGSPVTVPACSTD